MHPLSCVWRHEADAAFTAYFYSTVSIAQLIIEILNRYYLHLAYNPFTFK